MKAQWHGSTVANRIAFVFFVFLAVRYGGAKNGSTNEANRVSDLNAIRAGEASVVRSAAGECGTNAVLCVTGFSSGTNTVSVAFAWTTNFLPDRTWIEVYGKAHSLTNGWLPLASEPMELGATNAVVFVAATNAQAAFYTGRIDTLGIDAGVGSSYVRPDGSRLFVSTGSLTVPVSIRRQVRNEEFPPPDGVVPEDPFALVDGLSYNPSTSSVTADEYGSYDLPDGGTLLVLKTPKVTFGVSHSYPGRTAIYDAASGGYRLKTPYPIDSRALWRSFRRGSTPTTGCSCVPEVDYGGGLTASAGDTRGTRAGTGGRGGFPPGVTTRFDYADGGVWASLLYGTNVMWRGWCSHSSEPEDDGRPEDEEEDECCDCGDVDSVEGPSLGSVRFRIPLGSPQSGELSGFLYVDSDGTFIPTPAAFSVLSRADAHVEDTTVGEVRTVSCTDMGGRTLVLSLTGADDEVEIQVRDTASGSLLHTWYVMRDDRPSVRFTKVSVLGNVMLDKSYSPASGCWCETDEISGREDRHSTSTVGVAGEWTRDEDKVLLGGTVSRHVVTGYDFIGGGLSGTMRMTIRRELGADGAWKTNSYSYWSDAAHTNRHGKVRFVSGSDTAWCWRNYDDGGRETFRLDQRDGSAAPLDRSDYAIGALDGVSCAFATECGYEPLPGDSARSNDWDRVRVETRYAVNDGAATLIARMWTRYEHGFTNVWPVVRTTRIRACRANAAMSDPGNEVVVEERYDDRCGDVPYTLRGALVSSVDTDGVQTIYERSLSNGVVHTVVRRVNGDAEASVRRVEERDLAYGNLLYEAESPTADASVEFGWRRHTYDEKNRLRSTAYSDGTSETNAYSCCRLLWSQDRSGARRDRYAQTGTDHLYHAYVDTAVAELPKDQQFLYGPWRATAFKTYVPVTEHFFDGLGRETNTVARAGRLDGDNLITGAAPNFFLESSVSYPQGVSDVSESVGFRGLRTRRTSLRSQSAEITAKEEYEPGETSPSVVVTNVIVRGGGTVSWRATTGCGDQATAKWTCEHRFSDYLADGCRVDNVVTESSGCGIVTNSVTTYDFLGRVVSVAAPLGTTEYFYEGSSPRIVSSTYAAGDIVRTVQYEYDTFGERVGETVDGVTSRADVTYETDASNIAWRVETRTVSAGAATNSCAQTWTRLNGLSDSVRSEVVEVHDGVEVRRTVKSYNAEAGTERETVHDAAEGESWIVRKLGYPVEEGAPSHVIHDFYGPMGKVFIRQFSGLGEGTRRIEEVEVDALGDEILRTVCDRQWIDESPWHEYAYDCRGNRCTVTNALGAVSHAVRDADGNVVAEDGATYPSRFAYDTQGRRMAMRTTRDGANWDETAWHYAAATGLCTNKVYADGSQVAYTHTPDGLPLRTTYESGRWAENAYDSRRHVVGVSHSDSSLDFSICRDVFGRATNVIDAAGAEWRYEYGTGDMVLREEIAEASRPCATNSISRTFDVAVRPTSVALSASGSARGGVGYAYGGDGLLSVVFATNSAGRVFSAEYTNIAGRNCGYVVTTPGGGVLRRTANRDYYRRDLVNSCSTAFNSVVVDSHAYAYDALSRPTARTSSGVSSSFAYNDRGEVVSSQIGTDLFEHTYDSIGNQTIFAANTFTNTYAHNNLNQIETCQMISAPSAPLREITHDLDGNLTNDSVFTYSYDAANRLASVSSNGVVVVANQYDYRNRRIKKTTPTTETTFVYDDWNLIHESVTTINGASTNTTEVQYFWGMDLSETLQGAGGVGGLLAVSSNGNFYFPAYDNNGNITKYIDESGNVVAAYEYDDFGRIISQTGPMADFFRIRFSTKYFDSETGLYYYGYRFYSPTLMRWLNRDPIEEEGGLNLYSFCGNNVISTIDSLGNEVVVINHLGDDPPRGGWASRDSAAETVFQLQKYTVNERCGSNGRILFSVEITPSVLMVHVHHRIYNSYTTSANPSLLMATARLKENDHIAIARRLDKAFHLFKHQVESIVASPKEARRQKAVFEKSLSETIQRLLKDNRLLDRKGGPHVL